MSHSSRPQSTLLSQISRILLSATILSSLGVSSALALPPVNIPGSVDPSQVQKRFEQPDESLANLKNELPLPGEPKEMSKEQRAKLEKQKFVLKDVEFEGATVFTKEDFKSIYESSLGQKISLFDAQVMARQVTDKYRRSGYVLSQAVVPAQSVAGGVLKIRVVEGYVANVIIQGDVKGDRARALIQSYGEEIKAVHPVRTSDLERYLLLINDLPGANVSGLLRPSTQFGAADLVLTMSQKSFDGSYSLDNRGSEFIGPWEHTFAVGANSLLGMYDRTQLRIFTTSPIQELQGFELTHDEQLDDQGTKLSLLASHTKTQPGDALKTINIVGNSDLYEAKVSHPFLRARKENLVGRALFDWHDSDTDVFKNTDFTQDRLRVARAGGTYSFGDSYRGNNVFDLEASKGLNIFNASTEKNLSRTNPNGESDFSKFNLDVSRLQTLPSNFSLLASATGQYSLDPLFVAEQFSLGGITYGGAYDAAEILGDSGIAGKIELRYTDSVGEKYFQSYQLYTYYDIGRAWIREGAPGSNDKQSLASAAIGVRTNFTDVLSGTLEVAQPLTRTAKNQGGHGDDPRIFVGTTARF